MSQYIPSPTYLIPEAFSKDCQIYKMMRYIENPGIVKTVPHVYSGIFRDIQQKLATVRHTEGH